jgi:hypothetical protein
MGNLSDRPGPAAVMAVRENGHATGDDPSQSWAAAGRLRVRSIPGPRRTASQPRRRQTPECGSASSSLRIMTRDNRSGKRSTCRHRDRDESIPMKQNQAFAARFLIASFLIQ